MTTEMKKYCIKHDAFYDQKNDKWLESKCNDPNCKFCKDRPDKPSKVQDDSFLQFIKGQEAFINK